jgi:hypothetical protein
MTHHLRRAHPTPERRRIRLETLHPPLNFLCPRPFKNGFHCGAQAKGELVCESLETEVFLGRITLY